MSSVVSVFQILVEKAAPRRQVARSCRVVPFADLSCCFFLLTAQKHKKYKHSLHSVSKKKKIFGKKTTSESNSTYLL